METKAEVLLKRMDRLYKNIYNLLEAFQYASTNTGQNIFVELIDEKNNIKKLPVNSFLQLQQEINRIDNNFKSLTTQPSYVLSGDGTLSQYSKTTFLTAEYLENFSFDGSKCVIDKTSMVEDFVYPTIKLPIEIHKDIIRSEIYCKIYDISSGWDYIPDNPKQINIEKLYQDGKLFYKDYSRTLKLEKQQVEYFGRFTIETVKAGSSSNTFIVTLDKTQYTEIGSLGDNKPLAIGDILVSTSGITKYQIKDFDSFTRTVTLVRIGGSEVPKVGVNQLQYNQVFKTNKNVVNIPIKPNQKLVIFLSTENLNAISYPSVGIKIDTEDFLIDDKANGVSYTIDEYFQKYVTNFSEYLNTLINDTAIPYSLGIQPNKPVLNAANFKVIQINKHLIDQATQNSINDLNKKKQLLQNEIDAKQVVIDQTQSELDSQKFNSVEEKTYRLNKMQTLRTEINTLKANLLTTARDIDNNASKYNIKNTKPKYKVIGFWDIQDTMYSPKTPPQHIIKYEVQYRYLQKDTDISEATTYKMISKGKEVTVAFSNWNELPTRCLNKVTTIDGKLEWESNVLDSINDININQCAITINEGESIEIKVRAITEAGYPISPMKSEWSEPLRIDFPDSLKTTSLQATVVQNDTDLRKAEFDAILRNLGLITHISDTIQESEKTFFHSAKNIASGQYTVEQKNIPLDECIKNILQDIKVLKSIDVNENISVSFVDFIGETYSIKNNTTLEVFAGNYTDGFDLSDVNHFGDIIRKKGYLKIRNNNTIPVEIRSLVPGKIFDFTTAARYEKVPVLFEGKLRYSGNEQLSDNTPTQTSKQILYLRNNDLIGSRINENTSAAYDLIYELTKNKDNACDNTKPTNVDTTLKNIIYLDSFDSDELKLGGLSVKNEVPAIVFDSKVVDLTNKSAVEIFLNYYKSLFKVFTVTEEDPTTKQPVNVTYAFSKFNSILKRELLQKAVLPEDVLTDIHFTDYDKYAIGRNTVGAFLYPYLPDYQKIIVDGNTTASSLIISGESEILIPIIFEYRMTDALGNIDGKSQVYTQNNDLTYIKKIGFDILLNNSIFKFDLQVSAKLQSKVNSIDMTSVRTNYNNESKENLI